MINKRIFKDFYLFLIKKCLNDLKEDSSISVLKE
jgi:hypothetical protein